MIRLRIYLGSLFAILGTPLFIYCIVKPDFPAMAYILSGVMVAVGIALLYPARWVK